MLPMYGVQVQPLVRELRSHMLCGQEFFFFKGRGWGVTRVVAAKPLLCVEQKVDSGVLGVDQ